MTLNTPGERRTPNPVDVVEFEAATPSAYLGPQAADRIRARYGITVTRYTQIVDALLRSDGPHLKVMLEVDPVTTHAMIDRRWRARAARELLTRQHTPTTPASPHCQSGGHPGCTCDICY